MGSILKTGAIGLALLGGGILIGAGVSGGNAARGEVRGGPPVQAFKSGGQLSLPLLHEIAATLRQIDSRLARMETVAQKLQAGRPAAQHAN